MSKFLAILLIAGMSLVSAAQWVGITSDTPTSAGAEVLFSNVETTQVQFSLGGYWLSDVQDGNETMSLVTVDGGTALLDTGAPDIQRLTASLIVPDNAHMDVRIISSEYIDHQGIVLAPSKGNLTRDINPDDVPYTHGDVYAVNTFFPGNLSDMGTPYIVRDFRGQAVHAYPFQYNPVLQTLRIYTEITVQVEITEGPVVNQKIRHGALETADRNFNQIYQQHFDNLDVSRYDILDELGSMLVICYDGFLEEMAPFVEWKNIKGTPTQMVGVSEAGGSSANIASFIEDMYYATDLAFVLLVGDVAQVPSPMVGGSASDPSYGFIEGNDSYAEVMIGRFSAETTAHVETQVERSIEYERFPLADGDWYHKGIGIASSQGSGIGDDGEADWEHEDNIRDLLMGYGYDEVDQIYDTNGGSDADVTNGLEEGRSVINYTGHGSSTSWSSTGFNVSDVNNLENDNMLPFIWSVACVNGQFHTGTCFAEAWLRATNGDEPTGAIATLMSTVNQSWAPPMQGQDEFNDILTEQYGDDNIKRCFGGISANGCMSMNDAYGSSGESESDYWTLFGDPSVGVRTNTPNAITVSHDAVIVIGSTEFPVATGEADALAALSSNGELLGYAFADASGLANIVLDEPILMPGELHLVVTSYNTETYETDLFAIVPDGPYVVMDNYIVADDSNGNGDIDYGETVDLAIMAENVGVDVALNVTATVSSADPYITMISDLVSFGDINAGELDISDDNASFLVDNTTPDGYSAMFTVEFNSGTDTWYGGFSITINAYCVSGDLNADWEINVLDILRTVNIIINAGVPPTELELCAADTNEDGIVNILDIIGMINFIVNRDLGSADFSGSARIIVEDNQVILEADQDVAGIQMIVDNQNISMNPEITLESAHGKLNHQLVMFSTTGESLAKGRTVLFTFDGKIQLDQPIVVNKSGNEISSLIDVTPAAYQLNQNYPNPFNPETTISFATPENNQVRVVVYDLLGHEVIELVNDQLNSGQHSVDWNGTNANGQSVPTGMYIYTMTAGDNTFSKKMMLMK